MHRTEGSNHLNNTFTSTPPATVIDDRWLNAIQEEIAHVIEYAGLQLKTADADPKDQLITALQYLYSMPVGIVTPYGGISAPSGWFFCDGSALSKTAYSRLYAAYSSNTIGTAGTGACTFTDVNDVVTCNGHGLSQGDNIYFRTINTTHDITVDTNYFVCHVTANTFRVATTYALAMADTETTFTHDGTGTFTYVPHGISGASDFLIPDYRGTSLAGAGTSVGYTTAETFRLGTKYNDMMHEHYHIPLAPQYSFRGLVLVAGSLANVSATAFNETFATTTGAPTTGALGVAPRTGTSTRGKVVGANFIIKAI